MAAPLCFIRFFAWVRMTHPHRTSSPLTLPLRPTTPRSPWASTSTNMCSPAPSFSCTGRRHLVLQHQLGSPPDTTAAIDWSPPSSDPWSSSVKGKKFSYLLLLCCFWIHSFLPSTCLIFFLLCSSSKDRGQGIHLGGAQPTRHGLHNIIHVSTHWT